jgi:hypothetical protein
VKTLAITIPLELVHPHNSQNPKVNIDINDDYTFDPVQVARKLRTETKERAHEIEKSNRKFLEKTRMRGSFDPGQSEEEIEKLKCEESNYNCSDALNYIKTYEKFIN